METNKKVNVKLIVGIIAIVIIVFFVVLDLINTFTRLKQSSSITLAIISLFALCLISIAIPAFFIKREKLGTKIAKLFMVFTILFSTGLFLVLGPLHFVSTKYDERQTIDTNGMIISIFILLAGYFFSTLLIEDARANKNNEPINYYTVVKYALFLSIPAFATAGSMMHEFLWSACSYVFSTLLGILIVLILITKKLTIVPYLMSAIAITFGIILLVLSPQSIMHPYHDYRYEYIQYLIELICIGAMLLMTCIIEILPKQAKIIYPKTIQSDYKVGGSLMSQMLSYSENQKQCTQLTSQENVGIGLWTSICVYFASIFGKTSLNLKRKQEMVARRACEDLALQAKSLGYSHIEDIKISYSNNSHSISAIATGIAVKDVYVDNKSLKKGDKVKLVRDYDNGSITIKKGAEGVIKDINGKDALVEIGEISITIASDQLSR